MTESRTPNIRHHVVVNAGVGLLFRSLPSLPVTAGSHLFGIGRRIDGIHSRQQRKEEKPAMNGPQYLKRIIAGAVLSSGLAVAGMGLAAGTAQANTRGPYQPRATLG